MRCGRLPGVERVAVMNDAAKTPSSAPPNRLDVLGRGGGVRRKPEGGPPTLTARHKLLISYQIDGCPHQSICDRVWVDRPVVTEEGTAVLRRHPKAHEPLSLIEAADMLRIKRRNARELSTYPIYKHAYEQELQRYRDGERAANLRTLVEVRDDPGLGKAADRKVRLQAAALLNGEVGHGTNVTVNVGGPQLVAGVVIQRWQDEDEPQPRTIEHEVIR